MDPNNDILAFSQHASTGNLEDWRHGMTLTEWYAGQALAGIVVAHLVANGPTWSSDEITKNSFTIADAMAAEARRRRQMGGE